MGYVRRHRISATVTASGGAAQSFRTERIPGGGWLEAVVFTNRGTSGISTAANMSVYADQSSALILSVTTTSTGNVPGVWFPRIQTHSSAGVALGYTSNAAPPAQVDKFPIAGESVRVTITSGGLASAGGLAFTADLYISGN